MYIGESAGSIVTSNNIEYVEDMDNIEKAPNLKEYSGLGLINFYPIPHYNCFPFKKIVQNIINKYTSNINLMPISNKEVILVNGDEVIIDS